MNALFDLCLLGSGADNGAWLLYYLALVPALGVAAQWLAWRTRLPSILLLLLFGILLGQYTSPDRIIETVTGGDSGAGARILFPLVSLSVAVILFEGGLTLRFSELRDAGSAVLRLVTIGALVTMVVTAIASRWVLDIGWRTSLLIGAVLVVTGPTVISPLLRQIRPSRRVESTLKWEGIVIDPIGAVLAVLVFEEFLTAGSVFQPSNAVVTLLKTSIVGVSFGFFGAQLLVESYRRFWVPDYLQGILALATTLVLFSASNYLSEESGLIAVTVLGIVLANQKKAAIVHVIELKEHLRTLLIGCLFILLGSRIEPSELLGLGWRGWLFVAILILVVRPVSTFVSLAGSQLNWKEKLFVSAMAPRGIVAAAVASVFALKLDQVGEGNPQTSVFVSVIFLSIISTVAVYGLTAGPLARMLGLSQPNPQGLLIAGADHWVRELVKVLHENNVPLLMVDTNFNKISNARMAGLPADCMNILSDHAVAELNFANIGRLLALTPNDEVNSLAVQEMRHVFSSAGVYQLSFKSHASAQRRTLASHLRGRVLFGEDWTFTRIREIVEAGATFKATKLSDSFTYNDFLQRYGKSTLLLFVLSGSDVLINAIDAKLSPKPGDTIITLVPAVPVPQELLASSGSVPQRRKTDQNTSAEEKPGS